MVGETDHKSPIWRQSNLPKHQVLYFRRMPLRFKDFRSFKKLNTSAILEKHEEPNRVIYVKDVKDVISYQLSAPGPFVLSRKCSFVILMLLIIT